MPGTHSQTHAWDGKQLLTATQPLAAICLLDMMTLVRIIPETGMRGSGQKEGWTSGHYFSERA